MGRIKSKLVKRAGHNLLKEENKFSENFNENQRLIRGIKNSKKIKNQIAGYITRIKKKEKISG